jgi:hypothetical protein
MVIVIILCVRHLNYTENPFEGKANVLVLKQNVLVLKHYTMKT